MRQRLIGAAVLVPVVVILLIVGRPFLTLGIALLAALGAYEAAQLVRGAGLRARTSLAVGGAFIATAAFEALASPKGSGLAWLLIAPLVAAWLIIPAVVELGTNSPSEAFKGWLGTVFAGLYPALLGFAVAITVWNVGGPAIASWPTFTLDYGQQWLVILVLTVWSLDSFAYVAGRYHGRGRFMNHISPNKTWSGAIGGTIAAVAVASLLVGLSFGSFVGGALAGGLVAVAAQAGDLAESMLKRAAGAKDSGSLIPGHGGILDRVDSFLFAAPALYLALVVTQLLHDGGLL